MNLQKKRPCERDDLRIIIPQPTYWSVDGHGDPDQHVDDGELYFTEQYSCWNCGGCWMPDDPERTSEWLEAWRDAVAHVEQQGAA